MLTLFLSLVETEEGKYLFEQIYYGYQQRMYYWAYSILGNHESAEDAVQEALLCIARTVNKVKFDNEKALKSYVFVTTKNAAVSMLRAEMKIFQNTTSLTEDILKTTEDPRLQFSLTDDLRDALNAIAQLPPYDQDVLFYSVTYDMKTADIAKVVNRDAATVRKQLSRARKMVAELCGRDE